jgi:hypothetical protein
VETATQTLHRLTSYEPGRGWDVPLADPRVRQDLVTNDMGRLPWFYKRYRQPLPRVPLPRELPPTAGPAIGVLAGTAGIPPRDLDLPQLSRLLYLSAGVVRTMQRPYGTYLFRAAGSAGGRFPLELYAAVPAGLPLPAGVHWYDPLDHALVQAGPPPRAGVPAVVVTGVPWRTGWRYRERGYRHVYWDAGTLLAQLLALADSAGPAVAGQVDAAPVEFPLITAAQRAGDATRLGPPLGRGAPVDVPVPAQAPVEAVIMARGSARRMDDQCGLPESLLRTAVGVALRGISVPHRVVVHDVEGLQAGVYRWPDLAAPARPGALRDVVCHVCLDQALARDAAFVVVAAARLHLAAYALGACASGMTFQDSDVPALLGEPLDGLLFTCVGVPSYRSAPAGPPGAPTAIGRVTPR